MRLRAIKDLSQLRDSDFLTEVAEGLGLIISNARRLYTSAIVLVEAKHFHGARILQALCEEEASKYLILIDAIRCPRDPAKQLSNQLARFNDHLAKGLYAHAYMRRSSTLGELKAILDRCREDFHLDGPDGIEWIACNEILQEREANLYVDYVAYNDTHTWLHPGIYDDIAENLFDAKESWVLKIAGLLHDIGMSNPKALAILAELWRPLVINLKMTRSQLSKLNYETLKRLDSKCLLQNRDVDDYQQILERWQFPLYSLDLSLSEVDKDALRKRQSDWNF